MIQRLLLLPYTFVLLNWAAVRGLVLYLRRGGLDQVWKDAHPHGPAYRSPLDDAETRTRRAA